MPVQPYRQSKRCKASRQDGKPCKGWAMYGQEVCQKHGAKAKQNLNKAVDRETERKAKYWLGRLGEVRPVENHLKELQRVAGEIVQWKDACRLMVEALTEDQLRYESKMGLEQLDSRVALYERSQDRAVVALSGLARVSADERLVAVEEAKAAMIAAALAKALSEAGITGEAANLVRRLFASMLKVIPGEIEPPPRKRDAA